MMEEDVKAQVEVYRGSHPIYEAFVESLRTLLDQLFKGRGLDIVTIEGRAKTIESFEEKIQRPNKNYEDPINELTDLAGLRVVAYQLADVDTVCDIVKDAFEIDDENSVDKTKIIEADRFGYLSVHYVVSLDSMRSSLPENAAFTNLKAEIQIRTVLQHAWAAIDHKLRYKTKEEIPLHFRRNLYRISALLESADVDFERLRVGLVEMRESYEESIEEGNLEVGLDLDSVTAYAEDGGTPRLFVEIAESLGVVIGPHPPNSKFSEFSSLLSLSSYMGIDSLDKLDRKLDSEKEEFPKILEEILVEWGSLVHTPPPKLVTTRDGVLRIALLFSLEPEALKYALALSKYGSVLRQAFISVYCKRKGVDVDAISA